MISYSIIGVMSGTSTDGLDIAHVTFSYDDNNQIWAHQLVNTKMYSYPDEFAKKLSAAKELNGLALKKLDNELGRFIGKSVNNFILESHTAKNEIDAIASHGHTVFHQPNEKLTLQIGNGQIIATTTGIKTINNFREKDVLYGGQGAPLVPIGDMKLFSVFADAFLNLGGFANISAIKNEKIVAFDICPCNLPLNLYASLVGYPYDRNGELGRSISYKNTGLVEILNNIPFYKKTWPKSLGAEWFENEFIPLLDIDELTAQEKLKVCYDHISEQISNSIISLGAKKVLATGGGAKNKFLIDLIKEKSQVEISVPEQQIIDFKEAIIFALLGALFLSEQPNCLKDVTGASENVIGGVLYKP